MILSDFHVHTNFCDGKNTPEEMIAAALKLGVKKLGFSGHAHVSFDEANTMSITGTERYKREIRDLAAKYKDKIKIFCGVEQDYYSDLPISDYDYIIGSVHSIFFDKFNFFHVDLSAQALQDAANKYFCGDIYALIGLYYEYEINNINNIIKKIKNASHAIQPCIIGHFDLITKFNEGEILFSEENKRYVDAAFGALDELLKTGCPFEINTGAMSRGYRTSPYPSVKILKRLAEKGGRVILSSDSHNTSSLCYKFQECAQLVETLGLKFFDLNF